MPAADSNAREKTFIRDNGKAFFFALFFPRLHFDGQEEKK